LTEYILRPEAKRDLAGIDDYGSKQWGEESSADYLRAIGQALDRYAAAPGIGSDRSQYYPRLRKADVENHHAYYLIMDKGIDVIRILHPSMDARSRVAASFD